jgi:hypothetical protein
MAIEGMASFPGVMCRFDGELDLGRAADVISPGGLAVFSATQ